MRDVRERFVGWILRVDDRWGVYRSFYGEGVGARLNMALLQNTPQYKQAMKIRQMNEERWLKERKMREFYWVEYNLMRKHGHALGMRRGCRGHFTQIPSPRHLLAMERRPLATIHAQGDS